MKKLFITLLVFSFVLLSATSPYKQKLLGVWKIQSMEVKGVKMVHEQMGLPYMEFNEEGGFMIKLGTTADKGRYSIKGNTITLKFLIPKKPSQKLTITKLDNVEFDYTTSDSTGLVKVTCYKVDQGFGGEKD